MTKIYAVETGDYSDYSVVGVFSTEEKAKTLADWLGGDVTEWELDEVQVGDLPKDPCWSVTSLPNGIDIDGVYLDPCPSLSRLAYRNEINPYYGGRVNVVVFAPDEAHARKIAADLFREYKARGEMNQ
jgi:hypothetical protein